MTPAEPGPDARIDEIQSDIEHTRGEFGETVGALTTKLDRKKAVKPPLAIVASVAGVSVVGIIWWRKRSGGRRG